MRCRARPWCLRMRWPIICGTSCPLRLWAHASRVWPRGLQRCACGTGKSCRASLWRRRSSCASPQSFRRGLSVLKQILERRQGRTHAGRAPLDRASGARSQAQHLVGHAGQWSAEAVTAIALAGALRTSAWHSARVTCWSMEPQASVAVISSGFLLREIEAAYARADHLTIDEGRKRATLLVPVSKTDPTAAVASGREIEADCMYYVCADHARI